MDRASETREILVMALKESGAILSSEIENAFRVVPRHLFLREFYIQDQGWHAMTQLALGEDAWLRRVYQDEALVITLDPSGQIPESSSTRPGLMANMLEALEVRHGLRILEIGTGTGYNAALLSHLVGAEGSVTTMEINPTIADKACWNLKESGYDSVSVKIGDGLLGDSRGGPFDRIISTAGYNRLPVSWIEQLKPKGLIVASLQSKISGSLVQFVKHEDRNLLGVGRLLPPTGDLFIQMTEPISPPFVLSDYMKMPLHDSMETRNMGASLLDDSNFLFFLQIYLPQARIVRTTYKDQVNHETVWLLDPLSKSGLSIKPSNTAGHWIVDARGSDVALSALTTAFAEWRDLKSPTPSNFMLEVSTSGKQWLTITSNARSTQKWDLV